MKKVLALSGVVALFMMTGCNYHQSKISSSLSDQQGSQTVPAEQVSFKLVTEKVLQAKCLNCHADSTGNRGGLNLETYANFFAAVGDVRAEIEGRTMPRRPGAPLTEAEYKLVMDWIDAGAKEFADAVVVAPTPVEPIPTPAEPTPVEPTPTEPPVVVQPPTVEPPTIDPTPVKIVFEEVFKKVIEPKCLRCHGAENPRAGVSLDTYANVFLNKEDVAATVADGSMPRRDTLSDEQKKLILTWIEQGAIEK